MLSAFNEAGVEYLVVGAYAMAAHGCARSTGDIDLWVRPTPENAQRVWTAIAVFGAPRSGVTEKDFCTNDVVFQIGLPPQRIDILTSISGLTFDQAWPNRLRLDFGPLEVFVIGREDLMTNKLATGRPKDSLDADILRRLNG